MKSKESQTQRIYELFLSRPGVEISSVELHRVGSGKEGGWCNSLSRRVSDVRKLLESLSQTIPAPKIVVQTDGQVHSFYKVVPLDDRESWTPMTPDEKYAYECAEHSREVDTGGCV